MREIQFINRNGSFVIQRPEHTSALYFPIANEIGMKSVVTPTLGGDSKLDQNTFLLEPVSIENLHNNRSTRNFWCCMEEGELWSATGQSAQQEAERFTERQEESELVASLMWQQTNRTSAKYNIISSIRSFVPLDWNVEVMYVELHNTGSESIAFTPVAAIPIYGRSADNIRDHRHVTSLLHRIRTTEHGVYVKPTLSFDERGHQKNEVTYYVCGMTGDGKKPIGFYPIVEEFLGEGGTFTRPRALLERSACQVAGVQLEGKEALGGICFERVTLAPGERVSYTILLGATTEEEKIASVIEALSTSSQVLEQQERVDAHWQKEVNVEYYTGDVAFDNFMRWVSFQPFLRRIYGCSFLPHHDYGKGGRGWRDLWQDCLALLIMNPSGVRQMILDNYGGVRVDGTNATIIGEKQGQFVADRNHITRVWMDHGMWPLLTTQRYIEQTGDLGLFEQEVPYFKDPQIARGTAHDDQWDESYGNQQKTVDGHVYYGTVFEHLLLQHLCAFYEVGEHNQMRLRGADWNDAIDMANERGESVAFSCAYAGNLKQLAHYVRLLKEEGKRETIELMEEMMLLIGQEPSIYDDMEKKKQILTTYEDQCAHHILGKKCQVSIETLASDLEEKAEWMMEHIRVNEWVTDGNGNGWMNSYYDNHGRKVEGVVDGAVRMMLTGQVFALMSGTATLSQMTSIRDSARQYLFQKEIGGYRLNTNFNEEKYDMGRMFGFAYGEKENGAVFSHMAVMYAYALYQNGFVRDGYEALQALADTALDFETSRMYPGIPEYFNPSGRGMYSYLTGAASWYLLTMVTQVYGIKGELGNLRMEPKLVKEQFDEQGIASIDLMFASRPFHVVLRNPLKKDAGDYRIVQAILDDSLELEGDGRGVVLQKETLDQLSEATHTIVVELA